MASAPRRLRSNFFRLLRNRVGAETWLAALLQVLQHAAAVDHPTVQMQLLRAVQPDKAQQEAAAAPPLWSQACLAAALPGTVTALHRLLTGSTALTQLKLQVETALLLFS